MMLHLPNNQRGVAGMVLGLPFVTAVTDDGGLTSIDNIQLTLTHDGVYRFKSILKADCDCKVESVQGIEFVVGKLNLRKL
ncbi:MAG: hypothetical protein Q9N62_03635 [Ghiorsea sp.]|nr:hypothetical protein [Ghiorsea sp.]